MSVLLEAISVIVLKSTLEEKYPGGLLRYIDEIPNETFCMDEHLTRVGFMRPDDIKNFVDGLRQVGLEFHDGFQAIDIAVVDQFRGSTMSCNWLSTQLEDEPPSYCWLADEPQGELVVPLNWTQGNRVFFDGDKANRLIFKRSENSTDVYWDTVKQQEVFVGRAGSAQRPEQRLMEDLQALPLRRQVKRSEDWQVGDRLGGHWPIHEILRGGMGIVFIVYDDNAGSIMAVKTFLGDFFDQNHEAHLRFKQEAALWISLGHHPNIACAQKVVTINEKPHVFVEYVSGGDLQRLIGTPALCLNLNEVLKYSLQFCDGMIFANSRGLKVHRDIKPGNCLITEEGELKITDFGLAKLGRPLFEWRTNESHLGDICSDPLATKTGVGAGTVPYMAPEQFEDVKNVNVRADVFSFGVMLYQMYSGSLPFPRADSWEEVLVQRITTAPPPLATDSELFNSIVARCLQVEPAHRFADFSELREALSDAYEKTVGAIAPEAHAPITSEGQLGDRGLAFAKLGLYAEAINYWDRLLQKEPQNIDALCAKGRALALTKEYEDAQLCFDQVLEFAPNSSSSWHSKGVALHWGGDNDGAIRCYSKAVALNENEDAYWYDYGVALRESGKIRDAATMWFRTVQLNPHHEMAWVNLGSSCIAAHKPQQALECFQKALELNSLDPKLFFNLGSLYSFFYKDNETALFYFKKAVEYGYAPAAEQVAECEVALRRTAD